MSRALCLGPQGQQLHCALPAAKDLMGLSLVQGQLCSLGSGDSSSECSGLGGLVCRGLHNGSCLLVGISFAYNIFISVPGAHCRLPVAHLEHAPPGYRYISCRLGAVEVPLRMER